MTDREMLELAAKAGGYARHEYVENSARDGRVVTGHYDSLLEVCINPLTDDGDALRLAVKLGIKVTPYPIYSERKHSVFASRLRFAQPDNDDSTYTGPETIEIYHNDPCAATRRAIVRAAAEIGRQMEETK